jgi:hypothetical protein
MTKHAAKMADLHAKIAEAEKELTAIEPTPTPTPLPITLGERLQQMTEGQKLAALEEE